MVHIGSRDGEFEVDLECGSRTTNEENGSMRGEDEAPLCSNMLDSGGSFVENVTVVVDKKLEGGEDLDLEDKKAVKEKRKKSSNKKAPKPPRPPRGPSLCASDQKFIKEISELAMLKRARNERMKALKKMKAAKPSSSNGNVLAMVFTILFFIVILFQGMCTRTSTPVNFQGSPKSAATTAGNLISVQYYRNKSAKENNGLDSGSPRLVEQVSGLDPQEKVSRVLG